MKDKKPKLASKVLRMIFVVLFAIFITIYISNKYGYFEYKKYKQVVLTQEQIKKFETDIKDGKNIEIEDYLENTTKNYQTNLSKMGLNISNYLSNTIKKGVDGIFSYINKLIVENN